MRAISYKIQQLRRLFKTIGGFGRWLRTTRKGRTALGVFLGLVVLATAGPAVADGLVDSRSPSAFLPGFDLEDSRGVKMGWFIDLDIDEGGVSNWSGFLAFAVTNGLWVIYIYQISLLLFFAKTILGMEWLEWITPPITDVANSIESFIGSIGWVPLFGVIAGLMAAVVAIKGATIRALGQIAIAMVVAALVTGVLSNPLSLLTGEDGALMKSQEYGSEAAVVLVDPEAASGDSDLNVDNAIVAPLIDIFVRQPHQVLSFGQIIDGTDCEEKYTEAVQGDKSKMGIKDGADPRGPMGDCHKPLKEWADNTSMLSAGLAALVLSSNNVLTLFLGGLLALMVWSALMSMWEAIKFMFTSPGGVFSAGARGLAWRNISHAGLECVYVVLFLVFIAVYINMTRDFLENVATQDYVIRQIIVDILLLIGVIIAFVMRRKLKKQGNRMGDALNEMTGGGSRPAPVQASPFKAMAAVEAVKGAVQLFSKFNSSKSPAPSSSPSARPVSAPAGKTPVAPTPNRPGPSAPPPASSPSGTGPSNSPVSPNASAAEKQMVPAPKPADLSSKPQSEPAPTTGTKPKGNGASKTVRGVLKGANVAGQVLTYIPQTSAVGKTITVGTTAISSADRVHERLKQDKSGSWPQGSSARRSGPSVVNSRNRNLPGSGKPRRMDAMDRELQKMISEAASSAKSSPQPVKAGAGKSKSPAKV